MTERGTGSGRPVLPKLGKALVIAAVLTWSLGPIYCSLTSSLMRPVDLTANPPHLLPPQPTLQTYAGLLGFAGAADNATGQSIWPAFRSAGINSLIASALGTAATLVAATLGGYAFARLRFPGRSVIFGLVVATLAVPGYTVVIPPGSFLK